MLLGRYVYVLLAATLVLAGCRKERVSSLRLEQVLVGTEQLSLADGTNEQMPIDRSITLAFSQPVNQSTAAGAISLVTESGAVAMDIGFANQGRSVVIYPVGVLSNKTVYTIQVSTALKSEEGAGIDAQRVSFTTVAGDLSVESIEVGGTDVGNAVRITNVPPDLGITIRFSVALNEATVQDAVHVEGIPGGALQVAVSADRQ